MVFLKEIQSSALLLLKECIDDSASKIFVLKEVFKLLFPYYYLLKLLLLRPKIRRSHKKI